MELVVHRAHFKQRKRLPKKVGKTGTLWRRTSPSCLFVVLPEQSFGEFCADILCFCFDCFQSLMTDETIANVPILIFGNKIDRPEAISEERLREMFGLYGQTTGKVKKKKKFDKCEYFIQQYIFIF